MQKLDNPGLAASILVMATLIALAMALPRSAFDLFWLAVMVAAGLTWGLFTRKHAPSVSPGPRTARSEGILWAAFLFTACVAFGLLYNGFGSPPGLAWWDNLAMVIRDASFFAAIAAFFFIKVLRGLASWGQLTPGRKAGHVVAVLGMAGACPVLGSDLVRRLLLLTHFR